MAGPAIGALAVLAGPELPFLLAAAIAAVNAVVALRRLPETNPPSKRVLTPEEAEPAGSAWRSAHAAAVLRLAMVAFLALVAFSAFEATFALLGERRFDLSESSTYVVFVGLGRRARRRPGRPGAPGRPAPRGAERPAGRPRPRRRRPPPAGRGPEPWPCSCPPSWCWSSARASWLPTLASLVADRARRDRRGSALGVQQSAGGLARVVGPTAGGFLFQHVGLSAPSLVGAVLAAVAALLTLPLQRGGKARVAPEPTPAAVSAGTDATQASGAPTG